MTDRPRHLVELSGPGGRWQLPVDTSLDLGRESGDVIIADPSVSRRHLRLDGSGAVLVVTDLDSSNGTFVRGHRLTGPTLLSVGDEVRFGDTTLRVLHTAASPPASAPPTDTAPPASAPPTDTAPTASAPPTDTAPTASAPPTAAAPHAATAEPAPPPTPSTSPAGSAHPPPSPAPAPGPPEDGAEVLRNDALEIRYRPDTHGARIARSFASTAARARRALAGLGSEPWGTVPVVHLIDPYHDGTGFVTSGSVVDGTRAEAWVIVSPESPPEDPHRLLALLFGAALPAAGQLGFLVEGYGLHRSGAPDPDTTLVSPGPALADAEGEQRAAMALSFVRFLAKRESDEAVLRLLGAQPGRVDEIAREVFGASLGQLEHQWRLKSAAGTPDVKTGEFLRLSMRYLRPYKLRQVEIFCYMLLSLAFTAAFPFVTQRLFDDALPSGEFDQVLGLLVALGAAFLVSLVAGVRQAYQTAWISGAVTRDIRRTIFARTQLLPASWYQDHPQGDVLSRLFSDVGAVQNGLSQAIGQGIFQMISLVTSAVIMLTLNIWLGAIVLVAAPLVGLVYRRMSNGAQERSLAAQENNSALLSVAAESYRANPVVKMFGLAGREERRFDQQADRLFRSMRRLQLWGGLFGLSVNLIVTLLRLFVLGLGAWLILEGHFTTGGLVAFLSIMGEVLSPVTVLVSLSQDVQASMGSLVRINEIVDADTEPLGEDLPALAPMARELRLAGVGLSYTPERRALDDFDVTITAGTRVAFVGPSGSGKSTVLRLLMRLYEPDEGAILADGVDLRSVSLRSWRDQLGVVFQDSFLFDATVRENIALGRTAATDDDIIAAADRAGVTDFVDQLPRGLDTLVGEGGANLSGGQRQRVAIARALIRNPQLLLLDEATSALDPATERQINDTIERISAGRTVVAVTHRLASITDYDRIFVIVDGRLAEAGRHEELLARRGPYARLWAEQTGAPLPEPEPFDAAAALARIPFLSGAADHTISTLAAALVPFGLDEGRTVDEGDGVVLVRDGKGEVVAAGGAVVARLGAGDAFGIAAALGAAATSTLRATETMALLGLPSDALAAAAAADAVLAEALAGQRRGPRPQGTRVDRLTLAAPRPAATIAVAAAVPTPTPMGNATGVYPRLG